MRLHKKPWTRIKAKSGLVVKTALISVSLFGVLLALVVQPQTTHRANARPSVLAPEDAPAMDPDLDAEAPALAPPPAPVDEAPVAEPEAPPSPEPSPSVESPSPQPSPSPIPVFEARTFEVKVLRRSESGRTYLFDDLTDARTRVGRVLLLRRIEQQTMGIRVLRTYPEQKQFAAKRILKYGQIKQLEPGETLTAVERTSELPPEPPAPSAQDAKELKELEQTDAPLPAASPEPEPQPAPSPTPTPSPQTELPETDEFDKDLDNSSSPQPDEEPEEYDEEELEDPLSIDEVHSLDPHTHWLSAEFSYLRNFKIDNTAEYFKAGGLRYGFTAAKMMLLRQKNLQDSLVIEGAAYLYKILVYQHENDAYTIGTLVGTGRYNLRFTENLAVFMYGGLARNFLLGSANSSDEGKTALASAFPTAGAGLLFRVGPSWEVRIHYGLDAAGGGLVLRF